jgi:hypothetical protein
MRRPILHACALAVLLGTLLVPTACKESDTILVVEISGPRREDFTPWRFNATVTPGATAPKAFSIPDPPRRMLLPQSFSLALDHSQTGPVTVSIVAYSEQGFEIGYGTTVQKHIVVGGQTVLAVALTEIVPTTPDGGAPDPGDGGQDASNQEAPKSDAHDGIGLDSGSD